LQFSVSVKPITMQRNQFKAIILISTFLLFALSSNAQVLFTIDGEDVEVDEFKRMYEKSQVDDDDKYTKESVKEYVDLYIRYKLKLKEASDLGIDEDPEVLREIAMYEDQLVRNEFDKNVMNDLVEEAKTRLQEEICMRHILIDIPGRYKGTADTIYSYNQAVKVRDQLLNGNNFEELAKKTSRDMETKFIGGDLGCFTTLQLKNYQLENAAYKLRKGQISMPIRTSLGYHIIEVTDRRGSNGLVSATQLFIRSNNTLPAEEQAQARLVINEARTKLNAGEEFSDVAAWLREQEDLESSVDNIPEFMVGSYEAAFENAIFDLRKVDDVSAPIKTSLGWHIFKLNSKRDLPTFEQMESNIRDKIMEDDRYAKARLKFGEEIKRAYDYEKVDSVVNKFARNVAPGISIEGWQTPSGFNYNQPFFKIGDRLYTARQFVTYVKDEHSLEKFRDFETFYNNFETMKLMDYHKHNLVETDPEMKALMKEFRDGIILFNMMEQEFWQSETVDESVLASFYNNNKESYRKPDVVRFKTYSTPSNKAANKVSELLNKGKSDNSIRKLEKKFKTGIAIGSTEMNIEDAVDQFGKKVDEPNSITKSKGEGQHIVMVTQGVQQGDYKPFESVKQKVQADYQDALEKEWMQELKEKYAVEINESVYQSLHQ